MRRIVGTAAVIALFLPAGVCAEQTATLGWPEVIAALTTERSNAETCVGLLKSRAGAAALDKTKATYGAAEGGDGRCHRRADEAVSSKAAIPIACRTSTEPRDVGKGPQGDLRRGGDDPTPNTKGVWEEIAKGSPRGHRAVDQGDFRRRRRLWTPLSRRTSSTRDEEDLRLEAAKWPKFADIAAQ